MAEARITPPFEGQQFTSHQQWVNKASSWLTRHPDYRNTEHGDTKGWRGNHFTALAFDSLGRRCRNGADMRRAEEEGAFPVWWVWPDQICELVQRGQLFGPYAHLNGHRALSEDSWLVEDDPIQNTPEAAMNSKAAPHPMTTCASMLIALKSEGWDIHLLAELIGGPREDRDAKELAVVAEHYMALMPPHVTTGTSGNAPSSRNALDKERG